ncbi:MAG: hypothetical protein WAO30_03170, partial [Thermacetogeniaceae bacterium]
MIEKDNSLEHNIRQFLERIRVSKRGDEVNPKKYLLLLSIITLFDIYDHHDNRFTFNELEPVYLTYYNRFFPDISTDRKKLEYP